MAELFAKLRVAAGAPAPTLHGLRYEHAALMAQAGVDVMIIPKRLGHSNIVVTSSFYGHFMSNASRNAASKVSQRMDTKNDDVHTLHTQDGFWAQKTPLPKSIMILTRALGRAPCRI
ncbi:tyrosine-type recombinase/integrase [Glutamicibacter sp. NPDC087583]|uniref:tyrosine-type recombinase/integrase n=1 Tax=Glutamicibacter sp. NPDC087583 TaxID=3363995 RepID=UPI0038274048